jgi:hypothetical protein
MKTTIESGVEPTALDQQMEALDMMNWDAIDAPENSTEGSGSHKSILFQEASVSVKPRFRDRMGRLFSRLKGERDFRPEPGKERPLPIKLLIGYLPGVTKADALEYAQGVAARNTDQVSLVYLNAWPVAEGYAYEIQEGGTGYAYLPAALQYFDSLGPFDATQQAHVIVKTATRKVRINRMASGISALLLPSNSENPTSDWLQPRERLKPAFAFNTGLMVAGGLLLSTGFIAALVTSVYRYQGVEPPPRAVQDVVSTKGTPIAQWPLLEAIDPSKEYVKALTFENGRWQVKTAPVGETNDTPN